METKPKTITTIALSESELTWIADLSKRRDTTKITIIRDALKLYRLFDERIQHGETVFIGTHDGPKAEVLI